MTGLAVPPPPRSQGTVRRVIVYLILFVLVVIAASGVSGLLGRLFETRPELSDGSGGLALSLAFALIAGPIAAVLWWFTWRRLDGADRASVAWGLYLSAISFVALVTFSVALLTAGADLVDGRWSPEALATGLTWLVVWVLHRRMWAHPAKSPLRLTTVPVVLGAGYGLVVGAGGVIRALEKLFDAAFVAPPAQIGDPWWHGALQALVWAVGGALIWWWHWSRDRVRDRRGGFADVVVLLTGVLGAAAAALGGIGTALFVGLRAAFDRTDPWQQLLDPLPLAIAAAAVGAIVWRYHRGITIERSTETARATTLIEAGIGLVAAASGIGVVVNALLAGLTAPLAGDDARSLLLAGIASLAVGAPVWWRAWRPLDGQSDAGGTGRRIYLIAVFGVSAIVAIIALLVVGYRIFEFALGDAEGALVERVRAPLGLLLATALVAAYHFVVWRRARAAGPQPASARAIDRVILVSAGDATTVAAAITAATGAPVTQWARADAGEAPSEAAVAQALEGISGRRVLVVTGAAGSVEVIPLAD